MRSGWFWNTERWARYQHDYYVQDTAVSYKSSPLAEDHDFTDRDDYDLSMHLSQVIDLTRKDVDLWPEIRASYHSEIHRANERYTIEPFTNMHEFKRVHSLANGRQPRSNATYDHQGAWLMSGHGLMMGARDEEGWKACAYWIIWNDGAYYMSGPSIAKSVQHAVIWESLLKLQDKGVKRAELGQVDFKTPKEEGIAKFKKGFGGTTKPFWIATRREP